MTEPANWVPEGVDEEVPSAARLYDYLLGGAHNFAADRALAERFLIALPSARDVARLNRAFLRRAVVFMAEQGVRQFLDVGSGIPTVGNVHEIAQAADPQARVVYVDYESVAVAHSQLLLEGNENATILQADLTDPAAILQHPETRRLLDFDQPIGLIMAGVFHFVPHEAGAPDVIAGYRDALAPGSYLALSHFTADISPEEMAGVVEVMRRSADPIHTRTHAEVTELFTGFELVEPGVVGTALWRPDRPEQAADEPGGSQIYAGVGRKP
ncbi:S-adenosyl methyltransferase [Saccharopolyspora kobensis]|uniref:S-adenosyl methyltransferase n=1 Tax=Saccharopolyspora kobensis TaxID=146035 RepID=A0A1H6C672_9PSEU|nr:SAM-dependent methyltransferase [Saccharopolyspora kobensis]SEG68418.1 S-adenosyl methyltransferase [Saccharopolyspora kobensis]SFC29770.1 S-adenosyl methyltransferase [Saccharopolyspora kobensis]